MKAIALTLFVGTAVCAVSWASWAQDEPDPRLPAEVAETLPADPALLPSGRVLLPELPSVNPSAGNTRFVQDEPALIPGVNPGPGVSYQQFNGRRLPLPASSQSASNKALARMKAAETDEEKAEAKKALRDALNAEYDKYLERCNGELEKMEARLEKLRAQVQKRRDAKEELVELRLKTMENMVNGLAWPQDSTRGTIQFGPSATAPELFKVRPRPSELAVPPGVPGGLRENARPRVPSGFNDQPSRTRIQKLMRNKEMHDRFSEQVAGDAKLDRLLEESRARAIRGMSDIVDVPQRKPRVRRPNAPVYELEPADKLPEDAGAELDQPEPEWTEPAEDPPESAPDAKPAGGRIN